MNKNNSGKLSLQVYHYYFFLQSDASTKIRSQDINVTNSSGYQFTTGSPISAVYIGNTSSNYTIITLSNNIVIRSIAFFGNTTGPARVYYI